MSCVDIQITLKAVWLGRKHHTSSAQCSAELVFNKQVIRLAKHYVYLSNYAYNKKRGIFINSQILCALYFLW